MERWINWFDEDGLRDRHASVAVIAGFMYAIEGRRHEAELWLAAAVHSTDSGPMPDGTADRAPWVSMLRGMMVPAGMVALKADAAIALEGMRPDSPFMPGVRLLVAVASILDGRLDEAEVLAREARELSEARGALPGFAMSIAEEAALVLRSGREQQAWILSAMVSRGSARRGSRAMSSAGSSTPWPRVRRWRWPSRPKRPTTSHR